MSPARDLAAVIALIEESRAREAALLAEADALIAGQRKTIESLRAALAPASPERMTP